MTFDCLKDFCSQPSNKQPSRDLLVQPERA